MKRKNKSWCFIVELNFTYNVRNNYCYDVLQKFGRNYFNGVLCTAIDILSSNSTLVHRLITNISQYSSFHNTVIAYRTTANIYNIFNTR